jgi:mono/diheme cytochrome c family protein
MAAAAPAAGPVASAAPANAAPVNGSGTDRVRNIIANNNCLLCHRIGREGGDIGPALNGVGTRRTTDQIRAAILSPPPTTSTGMKNPMPSYEKTITGEDLRSLVHYLSTLPPTP